jgi:hypothetical protein
MAGLDVQAGDELAAKFKATLPATQLARVEYLETLQVPGCWWLPWRWMPWRYRLDTASLQWRNLCCSRVRCR